VGSKRPDETSGVTGDCHAPFCGSPGVRLPGATRRASFGPCGAQPPGRGEATCWERSRAAAWESAFRHERCAPSVAVATTPSHREGVDAVQLPASGTANRTDSVAGPRVNRPSSTSLAPGSRARPGIASSSWLTATSTSALRQQRAHAEVAAEREREVPSGRGKRRVGREVVA
jgi:hypothetical protein